MMLAMLLVTMLVILLDLLRVVHSMYSSCTLNHP